MDNDVQAKRDQIAARVKQARMGLGTVSQKEIADQLGWHRETYTNLENGQRDLKLWEIQKLAAVLGVSEEWLAFGKGPLRA